MKGLSLLVILICVFAGAVHLTGEESEQKTEGSGYICPPCGCGQDEVIFDKPGTCPSCGMKLVEKNGQQSQAMNHDQSPETGVAILIFNGVQIIDFAGPYEVFGQAGFEVFTVEKTGKAVVTAMGLTVQPRYSFANSPEADVVVVPGGNVIESQKDAEVLEWIRQRAHKAEKVLSVCNGAYILARTGLLDGLEATTFAALIDGLKGIAPKTRVVSNKRFVDNGKVVTSAGLSSGLDASLHIIAEMQGLGRAQEIATNLEYDWDKDGKYVRALLADRYLSGLNGMIQNLPNSKHLLHEGTEVNWQDHWRTGPELSAEEVQSRIQEALRRESRFRMANSSSVKFGWTFQDDEKHLWNGTAEIKPDTNDSRYVLILIQIEQTVSVSQLTGSTR